MAESKRGDDDDDDGSNNNNNTAIFPLAYESFCRAAATREWLRLRLRLVIGTTSYTSRRRGDWGARSVEGSGVMTMISFTTLPHDRCRRRQRGRRTGQYVISLYFMVFSRGAEAGGKAFGLK